MVIKDMTPEELAKVTQENPLLKTQYLIWKAPQQKFSEYFFKNEYQKSTSKFHKELEEKLDLVANGGLKRLAIAAPRGHGKSQTVKMWLVKQIMFANFDCVTYISEVHKKAVDHMHSVKLAIESNQEIRKIFSDQVSEYWSMDDFTTIDGSTVQCLGVGSSPRGLGKGSKRPKLIIMDDGESEENSGTRDARDKLKNWFYSALLPAGDSDCVIIVIGTIIHEDSLLNQLLKMPGWITCKYAAISDNGKPLWPEKFTMDKLNQIKAELFWAGKSDSWYAEYMNEPVSDENREFKREWIESNYYVDRDLPKPVNVFMLSDWALDQKTSKDYTCFVVVGIDHDNTRWTLDVRRGRWDTAIGIDQMFEMWFKWKPICIGVQKDHIYASIHPFIEQKQRELNVYLRFENLSVVRRGSKEERIRATIPWVKSGKWKFKRDQAEYVDEFLAFPKGKNDDMIDASSDISLVAYAPRGEQKSEHDEIVEEMMAKRRKMGILYDEHLGILENVN